MGARGPVGTVPTIPVAFVRPGDAKALSESAADHHNSTYMCSHAQTMSILDRFEALEQKHEEETVKEREDYRTRCAKKAKQLAEARTNAAKGAIIKTITKPMPPLPFEVTYWPPQIAKLREDALRNPEMETYLKDAEMEYNKELGKYEKRVWAEAQKKCDKKFGKGRMQIAIKGSETCGVLEMTDTHAALVAAHGPDALM